MSYIRQEVAMSTVADERKARRAKDHAIDRVAGLLEDAGVMPVALSLLVLVAVVIVAALLL
jgi:hypothetical protein